MIVFIQYGPTTIHGSIITYEQDSEQQSMEWKHSSSLAEKIFLENLESQPKKVKPAIKKNYIVLSPR